MRNPDYSERKDVDVKCPDCGHQFVESVDVEVKANTDYDIEIN